MRMLMCKQSKYTINISISRYEVQTKYNILSGKKLSADLIQSVGEHSNIGMARKLREVFHCSQPPCKPTKCSSDCLDDVARCSRYLLQNLCLFSFSQSIVEQKHPVHNDRGTISFQVGLLPLSSANMFSQFLCFNTLIHMCLLVPIKCLKLSCDLEQIYIAMKMCVVGIGAEQLLLHLGKYDQNSVVHHIRQRTLAVIFSLW